MCSRYIYIYTTYTYKNIYDLVSSQGEEEKKKKTTFNFERDDGRRNPKWAEKKKKRY